MLEKDTLVTDLGRDSQDDHVFKAMTVADEEGMDHMINSLLALSNEQLYKAAEEASMTFLGRDSQDYHVFKAMTVVDEEGMDHMINSLLALSNEQLYKVAEEASMTLGGMESFSSELEGLLVKEESMPKKARWNSLLRNSIFFDRSYSKEVQPSLPKLMGFLERVLRKAELSYSKEQFSEDFFLRGYDLLKKWWNGKNEVKNFNTQKYRTNGEVVNIVFSKGARYSELFIKSNLQALTNSVLDLFNDLEIVMKNQLDLVSREHNYYRMY